MCLSHFKFYSAEGFLFFQDCVLTEEFPLFSFPTEKSYLNQRLLNVKNWRAFLSSLRSQKLSLLLSFVPAHDQNISFFCFMIEKSFHVSLTSSGERMWFGAFCVVTVVCQRIMLTQRKNVSC